jgi:hypothetical protein
MAKRRKKQNYESPLEKHPKYVRAIGMISIENASLESMLGELLGALLGIHLQIGHTLFFTPRASIARLELLSNIANESIGRHPQLLARVRAIIKRSKAAMGKRHDIIHSLWAENEYGNTAVSRISFPHLGGADVSLTVLTDLIRDFRLLVEEVGPLIDEVQEAMRYEAVAGRTAVL